MIRRIFFAALAMCWGANAELLDVEQAMLEHVDAHEADAHKLLQASVNINSGTLNFEGVRAVGELFRPELERLGFQCRWIDGEAFERAGHLFAEKSGAGTHILLIGHLDTVFEPSSPFQSYEQIDENLGIPHASQHPRYGLLEFISTARAKSHMFRRYKYHYSNIGYTILGSIVDWQTLGADIPAAQRGYEKFVWSRLCYANDDYNQDPALTACLDHHWRAGDILNEAQQYDGDGNPTDSDYSGWQSAAGGWCERPAQTKITVGLWWGRGQVHRPRRFLLEEQYDESEIGDSRSSGLFLSLRNDLKPRRPRDSGGLTVFSLLGVLSTG